MLLVGAAGKEKKMEYGEVSGAGSRSGVSRMFRYLDLRRSIQTCSAYISTDGPRHIPSANVPLEYPDYISAVKCTRHTAISVRHNKPCEQSATLNETHLVTDPLFTFPAKLGLRSGRKLHKTVPGRIDFLLLWNQNIVQGMASSLTYTIPN